MLACIKKAYTKVTKKSLTLIDTRQVDKIRPDFRVSTEINLLQMKLTSKNLILKKLALRPKQLIEQSQALIFYGTSNIMIGNSFKIYEKD